jgi:type I restriction enzyme S subunit
MNTKWPNIPLSEIEAHRGGSVNPAKHADEIFELYSIPAYDHSKPDIIQGKNIGSTKKSVQPNDVLLSRIVPYIQRVWVVGKKEDKRQIASGEWIIYRSNKFYPPFLRYALLTKQFHNQFMRTVSAVGGSLLKARSDQVAQIKIPLPPLSEQKRIAAILDKADAIRRKYRKAIRLADEFLRSVFLDMFGDPTTNKNRWKLYTINELLEDKLNAIRTGPFVSQPKHSEFIKEGIPVLGIDNIVTNEFRWTTERCLPADRYQDFKRYRVFPDDVIVTIMGTSGRVAVTPSELPECMSTKPLCVITLNKKIIDPVFLWATLLYDRIVRNQAKVSGRGAIMEAWNMKIIKQLIISVPPKDLQLKFRSIYDRKTKVKTSLIKAIKEANLFFNSLAKNAFRGDL